MLDAVSLDQLRAFIAAVDEGSFSAASRKLLRSQSVVSETISNLEEQIGVRLFDRSGRYPKLTPAGLAATAIMTPCCVTISRPLASTGKCSDRSGKRRSDLSRRSWAPVMRRKS